MGNRAGIARASLFTQAAICDCGSWYFNRFQILSANIMGVSSSEMVHRRRPRGSGRPGGGNGEPKVSEEYEIQGDGRNPRRTPEKDPSTSEN
jgi:hypothetical protein